MDDYRIYAKYGGPVLCRVRVAVNAHLLDVHGQNLPTPGAQRVSIDTRIFRVVWVTRPLVW